MDSTFGGVYVTVDTITAVLAIEGRQGHWALATRRWFYLSEARHAFEQAGLYLVQ